MNGTGGMKVSDEGGSGICGSTLNQKRDGIRRHGQHRDVRDEVTAMKEPHILRHTPHETILTSKIVTLRQGKGSKGRKKWVGGRTGK